MQKLGQELPQSEIDAIIEKHDKNEDGLIQFDEFATIFKKNSLKEAPKEEVKEEVKEEAQEEVKEEAQEEAKEEFKAEREVGEDQA